MGDLKVIRGTSKKDAQSKIVDEDLQSEFDRHVTAVDGEEYTYISQTGEDLLEMNMHATLDGESAYDRLDYLGVLDDALPEMEARLSSGQARALLFQEDARDDLTDDEVERLRTARSAGIGVVE